MYFELHLVWVHPAEVGQDGQKGLSLPEQKVKQMKTLVQVKQVKGTFQISWYNAALVNNIKGWL